MVLPGNVADVKESGVEKEWEEKGLKGEEWLKAVEAQEEAG